MVAEVLQQWLLAPTVVQLGAGYDKAVEIALWA